MPEQEEFSTLLIHAGSGDRTARDRLVDRVYDELRSLAGRYLRQERPDHTLQPTALVHEAYMRLVDQKQIRWDNQAHFLQVGAMMMRRILVDHARKHLAKKRGGDAKRLSITQVAALGVRRDAELLAIDDALNELDEFDARKKKIVELRFFARFSMEEIARILDVSISTVERDWNLARLWLYKRIVKEGKSGSDALEND